MLSLSVSSTMLTAYTLLSDERDVVPCYVKTKDKVGQDFKDWR